MTWEKYGDNGLWGRIHDLHNRVHRGTYRAKPSKRAWIPKADGRQRPLGIASLEDKIVQQAVKTVLERIYEEDFVGFSYGFRPGRHPHKALDALWVGLTQRKVSWVLDADLCGFFDAIDHKWLTKFLEHRIADRRLLRLIRKWLRAGVSDDGTWSKTVVGTPQGAVISPLLANVFLHYVFDLWAQHWRKHHAPGDVIIVRYADDFVMGFQHRSEAERCLRELRERFAKFGLVLHPDKTRLLEFGRFAAERRANRGLGKPETFTFLGFTHQCGKTRRGTFTIKRKSAANRMRAKLHEIKTRLLGFMHTEVAAVGKWLRSVIQGWFNYHAVPGNGPCLDQFRTQTGRHWFAVLRRRSQKGRRWPWERMSRLIRRWLPSARILHPYPNQRLPLAVRLRDDRHADPALCPARGRLRRRFPWSIPFPPQTPQLPAGPLCSPVSQVLRDRPTPRRRACRTWGLRPSPAVPLRHRPRESLGSPGSRAWSFHTCSGSVTPRRCPTACGWRRLACDLPPRNTGSARRLR